jgi:two-component system OmpR family sensor kinase
VTDRLTRTELSWLLMQEARHAAKKLRSGVGLVSTGLSEPEIRDASPPSEDTGGVEGKLGGREAAMSTLSSLYGQPAQPRGKRGRIDVAALVWEVAPEARVQIEMDGGLTVYGFESELRRMLHVLMSEGGDPGGERAAEVSVKREGADVRIAVQLGPDRSSIEGTEYRWLARMAARHGGRLSLEANERILTVPAHDETNEIESLRKELAAAQAQGEAYARELEKTRDQRSEPPPSRGFGGTPASEGLGCLVASSRGVSASIRGILASISRDMTPLRDQQGEAGDIAASVGRHLTAASELVADLGRVGNCPLTEAAAPASVADILRDVVQDQAARAARHEVKIQLEAPDASPEEPIAAATLTALFHQLVGYAVAASPPGTTVKVAFAETDARILVSVEDAGPVLPLRPGLGASPGTRIDFDALPMTRHMHVALVAAQAIAASLEMSLHVETGLLTTGGGSRIVVSIPKSP